MEKNKVLFTYDPSVHDYSEDKPEFVCIGHDHWVYGNKKEIEEYKAIREKGQPLKSITILDPGAPREEVKQEISHTAEEEEFLSSLVHDTGNFLYAFFSFLLPVVGIIAAQVFKKKGITATTRHVEKALL